MAWVTASCHEGRRRDERSIEAECPSRTCLRRLSNTVYVQSTHLPLGGLDQTADHETRCGRTGASSIVKQTDVGTSATESIFEGGRQPGIFDRFTHLPTKQPDSRSADSAVMHSKVFDAAFALVASSACLAFPQSPTKASAAAITGNPFSGYQIYANPYYASEVWPTILRRGDLAHSI